MGLFDGWQFNPKTYQPQGGLLEQLAQMAQFGGQAPITPQAAPASSFPTNVVGALGSSIPVPTFGPDPAQLPQNAQPAQHQTTQPEQPGFGDRLLAGFQGFSEGGRVGGLFGALTGGARGVSDGYAPQNQTEKALVAKGLDPAIAKNVARDPALLRAVMPTLLGNTGQTDDIKEYTFAKREDPSLTFEKFMARKKSVSGEYGMTPIWGTGPDGKPAVLQLGKSGDAKQSVLPPGFNLARDPIKVEGPTGTTILDPQTRQQVGFIPKDVAGAATAEKVGEARGTAQVQLPAVLAKSQQSVDLIDEMLKHPGRETATGMSRWIDPRNYLAGTDAANFVARSDQLQGRTFLEAFESLKGGGAITEIEGKKAESAIARLSRSQSDDEYANALRELRGIIVAGMARARERAGEKAAPATGGNLKSKYGLD